MKDIIKNKSPEEIIHLVESFYRNDAKDVINAVSHDIKNPLGIIDLSLGLLEDKISILLEKAEPELANKITKFIANINHGIERCQEILDNTLMLRGNESSTEVDTVVFNKFFEDFSLFAKPSFKRAKVSIENTISPEIEVKVSRQLAAKLLIGFLKLTNESISPTTSLTMKVSFVSGELIFEFRSASGEPVHCKSDVSDEHKYLISKFDELVSALGTTYKINLESGKLYASLKWPNF